MLHIYDVGGRLVEEYLTWKKLGRGCNGVRRESDQKNGNRTKQHAISH